MRKCLILLLFLFLLPTSIFATAPNNIYGIHLAQPQPQDIQAASDLVNSNGGKWGYVTVVMQENDRDKNKWQEIFNQMRELHLIPIVRLATRPEGENWRRPEPEDAKSWVDFLDSLNWVVKNRYIVLFNEPNHGSEWGGEVDEKSYAKVSFALAKALKEKNSDYFIMLAGFDASSPSWMPGMEDEEVFLEKAFNVNLLGSELASRPSSGPVTPSSSSETEESLRRSLAQTSTSCVNLIECFNNGLLDGLSSHSYPNPNYSGSPYDWGRGTVRTYDWELGLLRSLGINKELPVFITETGWKRGNENVVANNFQTAFQNVWNLDDRVRAVTPFVMDYQTQPFLEFSWKKLDSQEFYQQYYSVQSLEKTKGEPEQIEKGKIGFELPKELVAQSKYNFRISVDNWGQAVWDKDDDYEIKITNDGLKSTETMVSDIKDIKPFEEKTIEFSIKTSREDKNQSIKFILAKNSNKIFESKLWKFNVLPLPSLTVNINFWPLGNGQGHDFEVQLFDSDERLVFKQKGIKIENGVGLIKNIQNIAIDMPYRAVILRPGYLPRQTYIIFKTKDNLAKFKPMLPFDINRDGKLDWKDLIKLFSFRR